MRKAYVAVSVASIWTKPNLARTTDQPATANPADIPAWLENMSEEDKTRLIDEDILQTQALFGTQVLVLEEDAKWCQVLIPDQPTPKHKKGYPGWIPAIQINYDPQYDFLYENSASVWAFSPKTVLFSEKGKIVLPFLSRLPLIQEKRDRVEVQLPNGKTGWLNPSDVIISKEAHHAEKPRLQAPYPMPAWRNGEEIVRSGEPFLGLPYLWAGMSSFGYDCSGLAHTAHKACGIFIPRDASAQFQYGREHGWTVRIEDLLPGDLVYFKNGKGNVYHVGIYAGNSQFLHASHSQKQTKLQPLWKGIYAEEFCGAMRFW